MTTPDSTSIITTTSASAKLYAVSVHSFISISLFVAVHRLTHCVKLQNCLDIIATQGACLVSRANTSVFQKTHDENFAVTLTRKLNALDVEQIVRKVIYRQTAEEWPIGHTPPEIKEQYDAEMKARIEQADINLIDDSNSDNDVKVGSKKDVLASYSLCLSSQEHGFSTSFMSASTSLPITNEKDNETKKCRTKIGVIFIMTTDCAENALPNETQRRGRKRRRNHDVEDLDRENEEQLIKTPVTDTKDIIQLPIRRSKRPKAGWSLGSRIRWLGRQQHRRMWLYHRWNRLDALDIWDWCLSQSCERIWSKGFFEHEHGFIIFWLFSASQNGHRWYNFIENTFADDGCIIERAWAPQGSQSSLIWLWWGCLFF